jgi:hypothetical protein
MDTARQQRYCNILDAARHTNQKLGLLVSNRQPRTDSIRMDKHPET